MRRVLVFGTFDLLHPGHLYFLQLAKRRGDKLVVIVTRDEIVKKLKKKNPILADTDRLAMVKSLKFVDQAFLGDHLGECRVVMKVKPDVIVYGYDQKQDLFGLTHLLKNSKIKTVRLGSWKRHKYSSTKLRND